MRRLPTRWLLPLLLAMIACSALFAPAADDEADEAWATEYRVKAVFLQRFLLFVDWPPAAAPRDEAPLTVGIVGDSPMAAVLRRLAGETGSGQTLRIVENADPDEMAQQCQVIFVAAELGHLQRSEHPQWKNLRWLQKHAVLTVGEDEDFLAAGGVINFYIHDQRVRFEISGGAVQRSGLSIRADLMRLARVVD